MPRYKEWDLACKVYVGNLGSSASKYEIEGAFSKYGPLRNVWVARNPPGFAFVEFEDRRDAEDAKRALDGTRCCGARIRVEMSSGRSRRYRITPSARTTSTATSSFYNINNLQQQPSSQPQPATFNLQLQIIHVQRHSLTEVLISNPNDFIVEEALQSPKSSTNEVILRIPQIIA
ncbi:RNA-binding protein 1 isoform X1 [Drosophila gunungcola]|uniref:RNA-binding protein 1 isoform X1 n=1 Tax=Drosophila elegans TaxID=30023 RepID=UPI0007E6B9F0|nr:RNA-binding protein 1 isoform X1 [Drosophila elegans]XP_052853894.1 RNA-binding protein 1 isoform X1 [Drosophila gunungcola]